MSNLSPRRIYATSFVYAFLIAAFISGLIALTWWEGVLRDRQGVETRYAMCVRLEAVTAVQRSDVRSSIADIKRGIKSSQNFLKKNPDGIPGIPAKLIRQGIEEKKATLGAKRATLVDLAPIKGGCHKFAEEGVAA